MNSKDKKRVHDLCNKSETYRKVWQELSAMPDWKKEVYNTDFATSTHAIKMPIQNKAAMNEQLENALQIMLDTHKGQVDKAGLPYILHPLRVMAAVDELDYKVVALLHDVVEDSAETREMALSSLRAWEGILFDIVDDVELLSRMDKEDYTDYIFRIIASGSIRAMTVKLADLYDNSNKDRLALLPEDTKLRLKSKYIRAINMLEYAVAKYYGEQD